MAQWVSNVDVTLPTHHLNHIHLFPTTNTASVVMVCVVGLDKVQCMMVTDGEVSAIHKVTQLVWCQHSGHALHHSNGVFVLWYGKHHGHVVSEVWLGL